MEVQKIQVQEEFAAGCDISEIVESVMECHTHKNCQAAVFLGDVKLCNPLCGAIWNSEVLPKALPDSSSMAS